ncbi:5869_t:CDS:2 [Cetraspora pellucida]|uniref:5869_t:CDS:1 n=1 Tax=Cetraspora pellucida TaxID=1433469 RepID=A0A9N9IC93_9GLOM|nr:5869_t:CDS:2 [Cetraspora pellucida]
MDTKVKRNPRACDSCRKDKKCCFGGENGVRSCSRCSCKNPHKRKLCSYVQELDPLRGHFEDQPGFGNHNGDISHPHDILDESPTENNFLCSSNCFVDLSESSDDNYFENLINIPHSTLQTSEHSGFENLIFDHPSTSQTSEYYSFGDLTNSPHITSQTIIPQDIDHMNNVMLYEECLKQGSKMFNHLTLLALSGHRNLTSPIVNECLKNLLVTLQSQSSQLEELSGQQSIDLESLTMDQLSGAVLLS